VKNQSTGPGDKRKKGFYAALSAGAGAVLVLALVISFGNLTTTPDQQQYMYDSAVYEQEAATVGADYATPYLAQADMDQALFRPRATPSPTPDPATPTQPTQPTQPETPSQPTSTTEPTQESTPDATPDATTPTTENDTNAAPETTPEAAPEATPNATESAAATTFDYFTDADRLMWPVYGDISMIFSQDRLIYNPTLDQWRTNDDLRISAQEGTPVRTAAAGRVAEIGSDRVYGNFVRIDNGNGWETIFGQLMDGILVSEGDIVQAGQVIGGVGRPSVFTVLDGHHVSLRVLHEDNLIDPMTLLADITQ